MVEARHVDTPGLSRGLICRAAAPGLLDRITETRSALNTMRILVPDFESRKQKMLRRQVFSEENVEMRPDELAKINVSDGDQVSQTESPMDTGWA